MDISGFLGISRDASKIFQDYLGFFGISELFLEDFPPIFKDSLRILQILLGFLQDLSSNLN